MMRYLHETWREVDMECRYRIKVKGRLDLAWSDWFDGFEITSCGEETILTGCVLDQAELHGLLAKLHDLRLPILLVEQLQTNSGPHRSPEIKRRDTTNE